MRYLRYIVRVRHRYSGSSMVGVSHWLSECTRCTCIYIYIPYYISLPIIDWLRCGTWFIVGCELKVSVVKNDCVLRRFGTSARLC